MTDLRTLRLRSLPVQPAGVWPLLAAGESRLHAFGGWGAGYSQLSWPNGGDNGTWLSGAIRAHWDPAAGTAGRVYYFCQAHEFDGSTETGVQQFLVYDVASNAFSRPYVGWAMPGGNVNTHSWDQETFDFTYRRMLVQMYTEPVIRWAPVDGPFPPSCEQTGVLVAAQAVDHPEQAWPALLSSSTNAQRNALKWHPNLYGAGQAGLVIVAGGPNRGVFGWRDGMPSPTRILGPSGETQIYPMTGVNEPTAIYSPALDMVIGGGGDYTISPGENVRVYFSDAARDGAGALNRPVWRYNQSQTPTDLWPDNVDSLRGAPAPLSAAQFNTGHRLMTHPDGMPIILENCRQPKTNARVKRLVPGDHDAAWSWVHESYFHPFNSPNYPGVNNDDGEGGCRDWPVVTVPDSPTRPGGLLMGLRGANPESGTPTMILWRPQ